MQATKVPGHGLNDPIHIAVDARPLGGVPCGYTVYLCSVIGCLRDAGFRLTLLSNSGLKPGYDEIADLDLRVFGSKSQLCWEHISLPTLLRFERPDIYLSAANRGIPICRTRHTRHVLVLHDVIPWLFFKHTFFTDWRSFLLNRSRVGEVISQIISVVRAESILTVSQQSAADIRRLFRRGDVTARLIKLKDIPKVGPVVPKPYFTYVGGGDFRKKLDVLLEGFAKFASRHPNYRLILVGSNYPPLQEHIDRLRLTDSVVFTGFVDHDTKFQILRESQAMVYPSLYEGYGLAIAEGLQAGIPVIAGCGGSQAEIGGAGVRRIDPLSAEDVATAMGEMLDPAVRATWIARGREQLAHLTDPAISTNLVHYFEEQGRRSRLRT